jgi:hypothetical protein
MRKDGSHRSGDPGEVLPRSPCQSRRTVINGKKPAGEGDSGSKSLLNIRQQQIIGAA